MEILERTFFHLNRKQEGTKAFDLCASGVYQCGVTGNIRAFTPAVLR